MLWDIQRLGRCEYSHVEALVLNFVLRIGLGLRGFLAREVDEVAIMAAGKLKESPRYGISN